MTAAELMAQLQADPEYLAMKAQKAKEHRARVADLRRREAPLLEELRFLGVHVESLSKLIRAYDAMKKNPAPHPEALPFLLKHLEQPHGDDLLEIVARGLGAPEAKFAWSEMRDHYRRMQDSWAKDGLAAALATVADDELLGDLIDLARDQSNGPSRVLLLDALRRSRNSKALGALNELVKDPQLEKEVASIMKIIARRKESP